MRGRKTPEGSIRYAEMQLLARFKEYVNLVARDAAQKAAEAAVASMAADTDQQQEAERSIYFIQGVDGGPVKIGIANEPEKRLRELQRTSPVKLRIVTSRPGDIFDEKDLHRRFAEARLHGEWFDATDELLAEMHGPAPVGVA